MFLLTLVLPIEFLMFLLSFQTLVLQHEEAHKAIYKSYGIESRIEVFGFFAGQTVANFTGSNLTGEQIMQLNALHDMNEIFFYQFEVVYMYLFIFFVVLTTINIIAVMK